MSQAELARRADLAPARLCRIERGERQATPAELERLSAALQFPTSYFAQGCSLVGATGDVHFRRKTSTLSGARKRAVAELNLGRRIAQGLLELADVPESRGPQLTSGTLLDFNGSPQFAAFSVRRELMLAPGPVTSLTAAVEAAGVFVFTYDMGADVMGASHWPANSPPVVCINSRMPGDRCRFTLAHELGHLVLHTEEADTETMESEANSFASELLLPEQDVRSTLRGLSVARMRELKHEWGVSMQALIERAHQLGLMSSYERTGHYKSFSKRGWRKSEPEPIPVELPHLVPSLRRELAHRLGNTAAFAEHLGLPADIVARMTDVQGGPMRRHLRVLG